MDTRNLAAIALLALTLAAMAAPAMANAYLKGTPPIVGCSVTIPLPSGVTNQAPLRPVTDRSGNTYFPVYEKLSSGRVDAKIYSYTPTCTQRWTFDFGCPTDSDCAIYAVHIDQRNRVVFSYVIDVAPYTAGGLRPSFGQTRISTTYTGTLGVGDEAGFRRLFSTGANDTNFQTNGTAQGFQSIQSFTNTTKNVTYYNAFSYSGPRWVSFDENGTFLFNGAAFGTGVMSSLATDGNATFLYGNVLSGGGAALRKLHGLTGTSVAGPTALNTEVPLHVPLMRGRAASGDILAPTIRTSNSTPTYYRASAADVSLTENLAVIDTGTLLSISNIAGFDLDGADNLIVCSTNGPETASTLWFIRRNTGNKAVFWATNRTAPAGLTRGYAAGCAVSYANDGAWLVSSYGSTGNVYETTQIDVVHYDLTTFGSGYVRPAPYPQFAAVGGSAGTPPVVPGETAQNVLDFAHGINFTGDQGEFLFGLVLVIFAALVAAFGAHSYAPGSGAVAPIAGFAGTGMMVFNGLSGIWPTWTVLVLIIIAAAIVAGVVAKKVSGS